jgi:hypothetical protein
VMTRRPWASLVRCRVRRRPRSARRLL